VGAQLGVDLVKAKRDIDCGVIWLGVKLCDRRIIITGAFYISRD
jgi:hypothetical protein